MRNCLVCVPLGTAFTDLFILTVAHIINLFYFHAGRDFMTLKVTSFFQLCADVVEPGFEFCMKPCQIVVKCHLESLISHISSPRAPGSPTKLTFAGRSTYTDTHTLQDSLRLHWCIQLSEMVELSKNFVTQNWKIFQGAPQCAA